MRERAVAVADDLMPTQRRSPTTTGTRPRSFLRWLADGSLHLPRLSRVRGGGGAERPDAAAGHRIGTGHPPHHRPEGGGASRSRRCRPTCGARRTSSRLCSPDEGQLPGDRAAREAISTTSAIRRFDAHGTPIGERRFLGLYPRSVAKESLFDIPIVRRKMRAVLDRAADPRQAREARLLVEILDSYPRDELLQSEVDDLYSDAIAILELQHRQRLRLRMRRDDFGRFFSCFVDLPLGRLTEVVRRAHPRDPDDRVRRRARRGVDARHRLVRGPAALRDLHPIRRRSRPRHGDGRAWLASTLRTWTDDLADALVEGFGEERGLLLDHRYANAMPSGVPGRPPGPHRGERHPDTRRHSCPTSRATASRCISTGRIEAIDPAPRLKLYRSGEPLTLSDVLPLLGEHGDEGHRRAPVRDPTGGRRSGVDL